ncbi:MAG TPA: hypothetical protein VGO60_11885, partial [Iamia sp.]|nr:hypothetical protein [Iamia sp.]
PADAPPTLDDDDGLAGSGWDLDGDEGLPAGWTAEPEPYSGGWGDDPYPDGLDDEVDLDAPVVPLVLAATDPAQPYGAALPWPVSSGRPARAAGAHVVLVDGRPLAYLERGGRTVSLFPGAAGRVAAEGDDTTTVDGRTADDDTRWVDALVALVRTGRRRSVEITKVDGLPVRETDAAEHLVAAGFRDSYRGLMLRG